MQHLAFQLLTQREYKFCEHGFCSSMNPHLLPPPLWLQTSHLNGSLAFLQISVCFASLLLSLVRPLSLLGSIRMESSLLVD